MEGRQQAKGTLAQRYAAGRLSHRGAMFIILLVLKIVLGVGVLISIYGRPFSLKEDIGQDHDVMEGLHAPQHHDHFNYAYSTGTATWRLPQVGVGAFTTQLRLAGVAENLPITTQVTTELQAVHIGHLTGLRTYHLLLPTSAEGNLQLRLLSTITEVPPDRRQLGVLVDALEIQSVGRVMPPLFMLFTLPLVLGLLGLGVLVINADYHWKMLLYIILAAALYTSYFGSRGKVTSPHYWLIGALLFVAVVLLGHFDGRAFTSPLRGVATIFIVWRVTLWVIAGLGLWYSTSIYPIGRELTVDGTIFDRQNVVSEALTSAWIKYDSGHYRAIAMSGYSFEGVRWPNIAFFPLFPGLVRLTSPLVGNQINLAMLLISHLALFAALLLLYDLIGGDFNSPIAYRALVLLLIFPTSFFFVAGYSESLALALLVGAVWAIRRQRWWLAGIIGGFLALTRLPGIMVGPILAFGYLQHHKWQWRSIRPDFLAVLLPPLGLALFMGFQWLRFGTPFAFLIAQQSWGNQLSGPWVMPRILLTSLSTAQDMPIRLFQTMVWFSFAALLVLALVKLPRIYGLTMLLFLLPPYLSNYHGSLPRYILLAFPAFIVLAIYSARTWSRTLIVAVMLPLLVANVLLFVNGFWVG